METDIFVSDSGIPDCIKKFKIQASLPDHSPSSCPKLRNSYKRLLRYRPGQTDGWTDAHTRSITRFTTDIGPVVSTKWCPLVWLCQNFVSIEQTEKRKSSCVAHFFYIKPFKDQVGGIIILLACFCLLKVNIYIKSGSKLITSWSLHWQYEELMVEH